MSADRRGDKAYSKFLMIQPADFTSELINNDLGSVIEVPCSYLKELLNYLWESKRLEVVNPVNEALVMGMASGYYLSTGKIPVVAMQNSGLMNTLNALTSLNQIYKIPVFYLITWRGEGGRGSDAPEHDITGEKMEEFLTTFALPFEILDEQKYKDQIRKLVKKAKETKMPVALIIRKNTFEKTNSVLRKEKYNLSRRKAIELIKKVLTDVLFVSSTGFPTRDSYSVKDSPDFYMVGSMGHTFSVALGLAPHTKKQIVVLDGDGSFLMHLGGLASFDPEKYKNIIYFILDNESYESTGGQQTLSEKVDFKLLAESFNFKNIYETEEENDLKKILLQLKDTKDSAFVHIKIGNTENKEGSKRVTDKYTCPQIKIRFMGNFKDD